MISLMYETFYVQPIKNDQITYDKIQNFITSQGGDYTTGCLLDFPHFKEHYKSKAIDLSKKQALEADPKNTTD